MSAVEKFESWWAETQAIAPNMCSEVMEHPEWARFYEDLTTNGDYASWTYRGQYCEIIRREGGHLCGYITFANHENVPSSDDEFNITFREGDKIGIDCAHAFDFFPGFLLINQESTYKNFEYVENKLKEIIDNILNQFS